MRPYKIGTTWIDLDHILGLEDKIHYDACRGHGFMGTIHFMFRNEPTEIVVSYFQEKIAENACLAQEQWDALKAAWIHKT